MKILPALLVVKPATPHVFKILSMTIHLKRVVVADNNVELKQVETVKKQLYLI